MILVFGGAYQGKLDYVREHYGRDKTVFQCTDSTMAVDFSRDIINALHWLVLAQLRHGIDPGEDWAKNTALWESKIIICDDISCGIVPMDQEMRLWRETTGRLLNDLARRSDEVIRVFCGLGTKLK